MSEEHSSTFMIEGVLGELSPKMEATEARDNREEDGSSSTLGKDDNEGNNAIDENLSIDVADQQVEAQYEEQVPLKVEESVLKRDHGEETVLIIENEVQIIPPQGLVQEQPPIFIKTLQDSSRYDKLKTKRPHFSHDFFKVREAFLIQRYPEHI